MLFVEPRFVILKHIGNMPSMATCTRCHLKFFTPLDLLRDVEQAERHLRDKFVRHECRHDDDRMKTRNPRPQSTAFPDETRSAGKSEM
jgi:hypothetical protein